MKPCLLPSCHMASRCLSVHSRRNKYLQPMPLLYDRLLLGSSGIVKVTKAQHLPPPVIPCEQLLIHVGACGHPPCCKPDNYSPYTNFANIFRHRMCTVPLICLREHFCQLLLLHCERDFKKEHLTTILYTTKFYRSFPRQHRNGK